MSHPWGFMGNRLLYQLPTEEQEDWFPCLETVALKQGQVLYEADSALPYVFFPTSATVSLMYMMENGAQAEVAEIGNEGLVGMSALLGGKATPGLAVVQSEGQAWRIHEADLQYKLGENSQASRLFSRYTLSLITHIAQVSACNRLHSTEQRLCRWLLTTADSRQTSDIWVTQQQIANKLGVRRETVTACALKLQARHLIHCSRGRIAIRDYEQLERCSCECHAVIKSRYDTLLRASTAAPID